MVPRGTGELIRLTLRRDRWLLPAWIIGLAGIAAASAATTADLYPDVAARTAAAAAVNTVPSLVALYGRIYDPTSLGALALFKLSAFGAAIVAAWLMWLVIRHTRADEEAGRLELVGSGQMARSAPLAAAACVASGAAVALGAVTAAGLVAAGLPAAGSIAFGAMWACTGVAFAGVAGVAAQLTTSHRAALGICFGTIVAAYLVRAAADLPADGPAGLIWLSPLGWAQAVRPYAGNHWGPALLLVALSAAAWVVAFGARRRRDLGSGLWAVDVSRPHRRGPTSIPALVWRLEGAVFGVWVVATLLFAGLIGSVAGSMSAWLNSTEAERLISQLGGGGAAAELTDSVLALYVAFLGMIAAGYGIAATNRLHSEEESGHASTVLVTTVSRLRWAATLFGAALVGAALLVVVGGAVMAAVTSAALGDPGQLLPVFTAALAQLPAAWVMAAGAAAIFGWLPRYSAGAWVVFFGLIVLGEFGVLWQAPGWLMDISPFHHTPLLPIDAAAMTPLAWLIVAAAALTGIAWLGWRRRDLTV